MVDSQAGPPNSTAAPALGVTRGYRSRCYQLVGDLVPVTGLYFPGLGASCFETSCSADAGLLVTLRLEKQVVTLPCPTGGWPGGRHARRAGAPLLASSPLCWMCCSARLLLTLAHACSPCTHLRPLQAR